MTDIGLAVEADGAVDGAARARDRQCTAIRIGVVGKQRRSRDGQRRVLRGGIAAVVVCNRRLVGAAARREHDIDPIVGGAKGVGREDAGGAGAAIGIDTVAAGNRRRGRCGQGAVCDGRGEVVVGRHIGAGRVVGSNVGGVGGDRNCGRQGNSLPAAGSRIGKGRAGETGSCRSPEIKDVGASVAGAAIEFESRNLAGHRGRELHPDFDLAIRR